MKGKQIFGLIVGVIAVSAVGLFGYQRFLAPVPVTPTPAPAVKTEAEVVSAQGFVAPQRSSDLAFRSGGRVTEILIAEGDQVKQGQALIRLQDDQLKAAVAQAQAALDLAKANLDQVQQGARTEDIAAAEAQVKAAEAQAQAASAERDRLTGGATDAAIAAAQARLAAALVEQKLAQDAYDKVTQCVTVSKGGQKTEVCPGLGTPEEQARFRVNAANEAVNAARKGFDEATKGSSKQIQAAQANVAAAQAQIDIAQAQLDRLKAGATSAQIAAAEANVAQAEAGMQAAQATLNEATLIAPFDGTIAEINTEAGQVVGPGVPIVSMADLSRWEIDTDDLSEVDVINVQPDQAATITFDALPGVKLNGKVVAITPKSQTKRGDVTYTVKIVIENPDPRSKWGMTGQVEIQVR
jgi:multidrug efflux pump subunit AcrA (membrane-fusion protein)